jgi:hypothetical protein
MSSPPGEPHFLSIDTLVVDDDVQPRVRLNDEAIETYAELYATAEPGEYPLPPLDVFLIDGQYVVADGHHRLMAAQKAHLPGLPCWVHEGSRRDAALFAAEANAHNAVPYTWGDKERIIKRVLLDDEISAQPNREISRRFGVSHTYVNKVRREVDIIRTFQTELAAALETVSTTPEGIAAEQIALATVLSLPPEVIGLVQKNRANTLEDLTDELVSLSQYGKKSYGAAKTELAETLLAESQALGQRPSPRRRRGGIASIGQANVPHMFAAPSETAQAGALRMVANTFGTDLSTERSSDSLIPSLYERPVCIPLPVGESAMNARAAERLVAGLLASNIAIDTMDPKDIVGMLTVYIAKAAHACAMYITELRHFQSVLHELKLGSVLQALIAHLTDARFRVDSTTARQYGQAIQILTEYLNTQIDPDRDLSRRVVEL